MRIRSLGYDSEELDQILCYFMKTTLHLQASGVEDLPLPNPITGLCGEFLNTAMNIFLSAPLPELARLLLDTEYDAALRNSPASVEQTLRMQVIKELAWHLRYDSDFYGYLLSIENIFSSRAMEYATLTFYPNLPEEIQRKHHIDDLIRNIPQELFRLDDF